jgi:acetolactate synthase-1/2/3 large subunit
MNACADLQRFAEANHLPVACAFRFQDLLDNAHPNYVGDVGIGINPKLAARVREADVILAIGPRLGEMTTSGYSLLASPVPAPAPDPRARGRRGTGQRVSGGVDD